MDSFKGCLHCGNLISHDGLLSVFSCSKLKTIKIENAGACFVADFNGRKVLIQDCPEFEKGEMKRLTTDTEDGFL